MSTKIDSPPVHATIDPQDPIPESNWAYRRAFLFLSLTWLLGVKTFEAVDGAPNMWTDILILSVIVVYTIAPSAEQATKMFQIATILKSGVNLASTATAHTPDGTTTTETTTATHASTVAVITPEADLDIGPRPGDSDEPQSSRR